ncbi:MAG: hypothetical protein ACRDZU_06975 [Acidimicrobiales bacterium]
MTVDRWQWSLYQLYTTADVLEMASSRAPAAPMVPVVPDIPTVVHEADRTTVARSTGKIIWLTARHTVASVAVLLALGALVDPVLPRPPGPHLGAPEPAMVDDGTGLAIPQSVANRP